MKRKLIISILLILCLGVLKFYHHSHVEDQVVSKIYKKAPLTVVLDWIVTKPFELRVYYTTEQNESFNRKHSVKKSVTPKNDHVEVVLPTDKIYKFRIDFGSNPNEVTLKNVEIIADQYIDFNDWYSYVYKNIEKNKVNKDDNTLMIVSSHQDPYMYWQEPFVLYKNTE